MDIDADATIPAAWRMLDDPREWADFSRPAPEKVARPRTKKPHMDSATAVWCSVLAAK